MIRVGATCQVGFSECRTLAVHLTPDLTLDRLRTCAEVRHRRCQEELPGKNLRPNPRCFYAGVDVTVSTAAIGWVSTTLGGGAVVRRGHVPVTVTEAGQMYKPTVEFLYLGGAVRSDFDLRSVEVMRGIQRARPWCRRYRMGI